MAENKNNMTEAVLNEEVKETKPKAKEPKHLFGHVVGGNLNLRKSDSLDSDILCVMMLGANVEILENNKDSDFYKVMFDNNVGYCLKKFIVNNAANKENKDAKPKSK